MFNKYNITISAPMKISLKDNYINNINSTLCVYGNKDRTNNTYTFITTTNNKNCNTAYRLRVSDSCILDDNDKNVISSGKIKIYLFQCKINKIILFDGGVGHNYEI